MAVYRRFRRTVLLPHRSVRAARRASQSADSDDCLGPRAATAAVASPNTHPTRHRSCVRRRPLRMPDARADPNTNCARARTAGDLAALRAVAIRVEHQRAAFRVDAAAQHRPRAWIAAFVERADRHRIGIGKPARLRFDEPAQQDRKRIGRQRIGERLIARSVFEHVCVAGRLCERAIIPCS